VVKNLSHVAFGRMNRRFEENSNLNLVNMVEGITGVSLNALQRSTIIKGASELELVNSGLEDTMIRSYHEIGRPLKTLRVKLIPCVQQPLWALSIK
jgi:glutamate dehydrogenase (NAD(P)+)